MKHVFLIAALAAGMFVSQGCDDDDCINPGGNQEVENTFKTMYPGASRIEWEKNGEYWVADFFKDNKEMEAWFSPAGVWSMTETDLRFDELPETVRVSFQAGDYKDWRVDDVDQFERKDIGTFYVLDVEQGNRDYDLYYSPDGTLTKAVEDRS